MGDTENCLKRKLYDVKEDTSYLHTFHFAMNLIDVLFILSDGNYIFLFCILLYQNIFKTLLIYFLYLSYKPLSRYKFFRKL